MKPGLYNLCKECGIFTVRPIIFLCLHAPWKIYHMQFSNGLLKCVFHHYTYQPALASRDQLAYNSIEDVVPVEKCFIAA